jgi:16S rRNA A1518/A1519 N6-dimethyltransferase RsmA/KsgA/DIM1 with predicted DNA glycosylase/AP lyase activity
VSGWRQARRQAPPNPAGAHFLRDRELINALVRRSGASAGKLAFDLGAGHGAIAEALAAAGARVIAVERDPRLAGRLRHRFDGQAAIRVVEADLRCVPLPRRDFLVVANPPFAVTTVLCRRLLGEPAVPLAGAELILQWGAARWLASPRPRDAETAWWACRYEITLTRRVRASSFLPPPSTDAAQVSVRRRPGAWSPAAHRALRRLLRAAYDRRDEPLGRALRGLERGGRAASGFSPRDLVVEAGVSPRTPGALVTAEEWSAIGRQLAHDRHAKPDTPACP